MLCTQCRLHLTADVSKRCVVCRRKREPVVYTCATCEKTFRFKRPLREHRYAVHGLHWNPALDKKGVVR